MVRRVRNRHVTLTKVERLRVRHIGNDSPTPKGLVCSYSHLFPEVRCRKPNHDDELKDFENPGRTLLGLLLYAPYVRPEIHWDTQVEGLPTVSHEMATHALEEAKESLLASH